MSLRLIREVGVVHDCLEIEKLSLLGESGLLHGRFIRGVRFRRRV